MAKRVCKCGVIVDGACKRCERVSQQTTGQRGYDYAWRVTSVAYRNENPLCEVCQIHERTTPAVHVHHIVPISACKALRLEWSNLIAVCEACHEEIEGKPDPRKQYV
jgi:5-methylcytosine-specific restriction protein A